MNNTAYLEMLSKRSSFTRDELHSEMNDCGFIVGEALFKVKLQALISANKIIRVGRNAYCVPREGIKKYQHEYSELAEGIAEKIIKTHPYLRFMIFETIQLNEFINHQIAHNVVFVSVEDVLGDFVFDTLKGAYSGRILNNPTIKIFHQYWYSDMIVIRKLVTEAPVDRNCLWATKLEKFLVDIIADPLLLDSVSETEYPAIFEGAFQKYAVDESCLFRYAKRRGNDKNILQLIGNETNILLKTRERKC